MATSRSPASSHAHVGYSSQGLFPYEGDDDHSDGEILDPDTVSPDVLVEHLLAAKRALSLFPLLKHVEDLTYHARQLHEESVVLSSQTAFLKRGMVDQIKLLRRVQYSMIQTYDISQRELKKLLKNNMDHAGAEMTKTMDKLKAISVDSVFRPPGEPTRYLFDFVSEEQVGTMFADLRDGVDQIHHGQESFHEALAQFDTELRDLANTLSSISTTPTNPSSALNRPGDNSIFDLLLSIIKESHLMAEDLTALNDHHDMCCVAVRSTEGGTEDLARRKAAQGSVDTSLFSISDVLSEHGDELAKLSRAEAVNRVVRDAQKVNGILRDVNDKGELVQRHYDTLHDKFDYTKAVYETSVATFRHLEGIGSKLEGYIETANTFVSGWNDHKEAILDTLSDMEQLRCHWERYAEGYDSLVLEVERRRVVEEKIHTIWRKAKEQVDRLVEQDWTDRENFTAELGGYIPSDLWVGKSGPLRKWEVVLAQLDEGSASASGKGRSDEMPRQEQGSAAMLDRGVVDGALERINVSSSSKRQ